MVQKLREKRTMVFLDKLISWSKLWTLICQYLSHYAETYFCKLHKAQQKGFHTSNRPVPENRSQWCSDCNRLSCSQKPNNTGFVQSGIQRRLSRLLQVSQMSSRRELSGNWSWSCRLEFWGFQFRSKCLYQACVIFHFLGLTFVISGFKPPRIPSSSLYCQYPHQFWNFWIKPETLFGTFEFKKVMNWEK